MRGGQGHQPFEQIFFGDLRRLGVAQGLEHDGLDGGQGVLHPMVQLINHQPLQVAGPDILGDVAHHAGEEPLAAPPPLRHREFEGEGLTVLAQTGHGLARADDPPHARRPILIRPPFAGVAIRRGHQVAQITAHHLLAVIAEQALGRGVEGADLAGLIDDHDGLDGGVKDGAIMVFVLPRFPAKDGEIVFDP
ncbi:hypothetical protein GALL_533950 [mine drainage metagenome]|uniref:Uncharacterized protein n=1 Tax=mine drainage metagenome TaxID=410659 RepID=A0A1J5P317_9ZZZZ